MDFDLSAEMDAMLLTKRRLLALWPQLSPEQQDALWPRFDRPRKRVVWQSMCGDGKSSIAKSLDPEQLTTLFLRILSREERANDASCLDVPLVARVWPLLTWDERKSVLDEISQSERVELFMLLPPNEQLRRVNTIGMELLPPGVQNSLIAFFEQQKALLRSVILVERKIHD